MKMILLGPPGAGKGTHGKIIAERYNIPIISTGDMIREAIKKGTEVGIVAKDIISKGQLLSDEIVIEMVKERVGYDDCKNGFILDGFPRTVVQAEALSKMGECKPDIVLELYSTDGEIVERLSGRRVCPDCGQTYHVTNNKPNVEGRCDNCNAQLIIREDDAEDTIKDRLKVYHLQTEPLTDYYKKQGILRSVHVRGELMDVAAEIAKTLEG